MRPSDGGPGPSGVAACRGCAAPDPVLFLPLGEHPLANGFLEAGQLNRPEPKFPLDAHVCLSCGLIQIADQVPEGFFEHYVYVPSASDTMRRHFERLADLVADGLLEEDDGLVVDIGCNDGLFLDAVRRRGARALGVDPASNIVARAREKGIEVLQTYFGPDVAGDILRERGPAQVVVTTNTYHHVGDLASFTRGVEALLDERGIFVIEVPHALKLVDGHQFDGIYHEHVSQFTVRAIADHVERFGLKVVDVEPLPVHGGSVRVFVARRESPRTPSARLERCLENERAAGLFEIDTYRTFHRAVEERREALLGLLSELRGRGERVAGYGASARGNTLLNYYGIGNEHLEYIVDRNELKQGLFTPGMHIPVVGLERLAETPPDSLLLLAWNFAEEIRAQQTAFLRQGGRLILPLPEVEVLGDESGPALS